MTANAWLAHLASVARAPLGRPRVVGLVGQPGSGKSSLASRVAHALGAAGVPSLALGMDGFHLTLAQLAAMPDPAAALVRRGAPWTFDPQALAEHLHQLRLGTPDQTWPAFAHDVGDPVAHAIDIPAGLSLVLVEGLYLLHTEHGWNLAGLLDECAYLDTPPGVAAQRLLLRHQGVWGLTEPQAQARMDANDALNAVMVSAARERADYALQP